MLSLQDIQTAQTNNPPQFGPQGQVLPSLGSGTPAGDLSSMRGGTSPTPTNQGSLGGGDQSVQFGLALQNLLKQSQQLGTKSFVTQGLNASDAQNQAISAQTPQSLIGANPSLQNSVRSNQAQAFSPLIQGANSAAQTFGEQLNSFGNSIKDAQSFVQAQQAHQQQLQTNAQQLIHDAISGGSTALQGFLADPNSAQVVKAAGYSSQTLQGTLAGLQKSEKLKEDTSKTTQVVEANGHQLLIDSKTGNIVKDLGTAYHASSSSSNSSNTNLGSVPIISTGVDSAVANIIAQNPDSGQPGGKGWGTAFDAIKAKYGDTIAQKYAPWLQSVYGNKQPISSVYQPSDVSGIKAIDLSRLSATANRVTAQYSVSPITQAVSNGSIYLQRINAAGSQPGSVSDADLLDSLTKLNTGGNIVTDTQIKTITGGASLNDWANTLTNKLNNGGILSDNQRQQITKLAQKVYQGYQAAYQPLYDEASSKLRQSSIPESLNPLPDWNTLTAPDIIQSSASNNLQAPQNNQTDNSDPLGLFK